MGLGIVVSLLLGALGRLASVGAAPKSPVGTMGRGAGNAATPLPLSDCWVLSLPFPDEGQGGGGGDLPVPLGGPLIADNGAMGVRAGRRCN